MTSSRTSSAGPATPSPARTARIDALATQRHAVVVRAAALAALVAGVVGAAALAALVAGVVACGGPQQPKADGDGALENRSPVTDTRTPIEKRRDTACEQLGPKLTACAVEDARGDLAAGKVAQAQFDRDTAPDVQRKNTDEFVKACKGASYSSRQVRVLEVCFREEPRCAPLLECLGHLNDTGANR